MHCVVLRHETDWDGWRTATRALVMARVLPVQIGWLVGDPADLLAQATPLPQTAGTFNVPRSLVELAQTAIQHRDDRRFALLYSLILRAHQGERAVLDMQADPDLQQARRWAQAVRRDAHRMLAFLRFRAVQEHGRDTACHVGWFEPDHYVVEATALSFVRRFAAMAWSILTPYRSAHWDGHVLTFGPGADRGEVGDDTALEAYWRANFSTLFRSGAQADAHQPDASRRFWRNPTHGSALPGLARPVQDDPPEELQEPDVRSSEKLPLGAVRARSRDSGPAAADTVLARAAHEAEDCQRCHLWEPATQTVFGEGPEDAHIMLVGEQPGDQEDVIGRPFVGPAGQLLDRALDESGIDRRSVYVTNAVKHFKFVPRGKRRIHQKPDTPEIVACRHWLDQELDAVKPGLIVLMGATAARAMMERNVTIGRERGTRLLLPGGQDGMVTVHPSYLLRLPDEESKAREYRAFVADLRKAAAIAADIPPRR